MSDGDGIFGKARDMAEGQLNEHPLTDEEKAAKAAEEAEAAGERARNADKTSAGPEAGESADTDD